MEDILLREDNLATRIYFVRGEKVMVDFDLAMLYGVETAQLKRAVRRNLERFPADFMFELTREELENLRCQIGISSWGGVRYLPFVFTEQGVAMLSGVLNSERAVKANIEMGKIEFTINVYNKALDDMDIHLSKYASEIKSDKDNSTTNYLINSLKSDKAKLLDYINDLAI